MLTIEKTKYPMTDDQVRRKIILAITATEQLYPLET